VTVEGKHRLSVLGRLLLEDLPAGHADRPGADALGREALLGLDDQPHLAPGGHQEHVGLAARGVDQDVGSLPYAGLPGATLLRSKVGIAWRLNARIAGW
jgi:hypothetical protein